MLQSLVLVDNICHSLMGAALGQAGLARRTTLGMSTLVIANNLPDIDVAVFATHTLAMSFRRGWTHGVLALALLPLALTASMLAYDRFVVRRRPGAPPAKAGELLLLAYIGVLMHVFMDFLNSYGVRLLMPFSGRWFYGDALYIVDPWMYLALGCGWWFTRRREQRSHSTEGPPQGGRHIADGATEGPPEGGHYIAEGATKGPPQGGHRITTPARIGVVTAVVYMLVMLGSNLLARVAVRDGLVRAGRPSSTRFMVTPVLVNPFKREVVVDMGHRYEKGLVWFEPLPHFRPAGFGIDTGLDDPAVQAALHTPRARAFLNWSRFPFAMVDRSGPTPAIWLNDYRYASVGLGGWSAVRIQLQTQIQ